MTDERIRIAKIRECIDNIQKYTAQGKERFMEDSLVQDAVLRNFQVIGQVVKELPAPLKSEYSADWKEAAQFRDKITHDYFDVDFEIVWTTIEEKIPKLRTVIDQIEKDKKAIWEELRHSKLKDLLSKDRES